MTEGEKQSGVSQLRNETVDKITTLISSALGLVAALAWNSAIQALFKQIFGTQSGLIAMFSYAVLVTVIAVVVIIYLTKVMTRLKG